MYIFYIFMDQLSKEKNLVQVELLAQVLTLEYRTQSNKIDLVTKIIQRP
uniref:Uncharacterized protein n=1 Tax=Arundo donax TaxID=35708 RepID=A0A0A9BW05_ARUDO